jgi:hypothetical protein
LLTGYVVECAGRRATEERSDEFVMGVFEFNDCYPEIFLATFPRVYDYGDEET